MPGALPALRIARSLTRRLLRGMARCARKQRSDGEMKAQRMAIEKQEAAYDGSIGVAAGA